MLDLDLIARHERKALSFSGGKDSTAVWHMLRDAGVLDQFTVYHTDTGDLLPETRAVVAHYEAMTPRFVRIETDVDAWIAEHGLPTDLLPHSAHWVGREMGEARTPLVARYDCCVANLMLPTYRRIKEDGNTLLVRGTKAADMRRLPAGTGDVLDGVEFYYPLQGWSHQEVFDYLAERGAVVSRVYEHVTNSPECAACSAWWGERRAAYLKRRHPVLYRKYKERLDLVVAEIEPVVGTLLPEISAPLDAPALPIRTMEAAGDCLAGAGVRVLQGNRLGPDDLAHVYRLMDYMVLPQGATVLDAGCGTGEMARIIGARRRDLRFVLLNKSEHQLRQAPGGERFRRLLGDFHALPLSDASVDVVVFCCALCHADHAVALREAARVTKPGGHLFVYDYERLRGDNDLMERTLFARAYRQEEIEALAGMAGWSLEFADHPDGEDLFRTLFDDPDLHRRIFQDLRPVVWRFARMGSA